MSIIYNTLILLKDSNIPNITKKNTPLGMRARVRVCARVCVGIYNNFDNKIII